MFEQSIVGKTTKHLQATGNILRTDKSMVPGIENRGEFFPLLL